MHDAGTSGYHRFTSSRPDPVRRSDRIMKVKDGMSQVVLSVGPSHTLRQAARMMSAQRVGAAVVLDNERSGIGILTERDILNSLGGDQDPDSELVADHRTPDVVDRKSTRLNSSHLV